MISAITTLLVSLPLLAQGAAQWPADEGLAVGDTICTYGFIMDNFCVERGTLLDAPDVVTLLNPELHTLHCLLDVPPCFNSPFHILQPPAEGEEMYGTGWQVDDNELFMTEGRAQGSTDLGCTTCPGDGMQRVGFAATVVGNIASLDPPVLTVTAVNTIEEGEQGDCSAAMMFDMMGNMMGDMVDGMMDGAMGGMMGGGDDMMGGDMMAAALMRIEAKLDALLAGSCPNHTMPMMYNDMDGDMGDMDPDMDEGTVEAAEDGDKRLRRN